MALVAAFSGRHMPSGDSASEDRTLVIPDVQSIGVGEIEAGRKAAKEAQRAKTVRSKAPVGSAGDKPARPQEAPTRAPRRPPWEGFTGASETRTRDLLHAMQTRSQLRHGPGERDYASV